MMPGNALEERRVEKGRFTSPIAEQPTQIGVAVDIAEFCFCWVMEKKEEGEKGTEGSIK